MNYIDGQTDKTGLEIAVIGIAVRFPDAENIDEFWANLKQGVHSVRFFSEEQLIEKRVPADVISRDDFVKTNGAILDKKEFFDASFFGYIPDEAREMDPQIRIFHEVVWHALEHAAYNPFTFEGLIGLYAGASPHFYWEALSTVASGETSASRLGANYVVDKDFLATRISYNLNLRGPSINIQTACSTGLVAIHLACQALLSGECDMALAGGVGISSKGTAGYIYQQGMINSSDGFCRSFDADSSGTVSGEGAGVVLLKPLEEAIADRDCIHAVVKGSALNNDGRSKVGFTAPSTAGQAGVIRSAYRASGVDPGTISYIETHGSGTSLGDSIEVEALKLAFDSSVQSDIGLGAVKSNIGHLDAAAGIAGFIKTVLVLQNQEIPPTLHFKKNNPNIDFSRSPFFVVGESISLRDKGFPLRAGVSSFGIGGTNAHIVVEEAPPITYRQNTQNEKNSQLIILSAISEAVLAEKTDDLVRFLGEAGAIDIADLAYTLQVGRAAFPCRRYLVANDIDELKNNLGNNSSRGNASIIAPKDNPPVAFMFAGQDSQYPGMAFHLYREFPQFKKHLDKLLHIAEDLGASDCRNFLLDDPDENAYKVSANCQNQQLALFIFGSALAMLLIDWGIRPDTVIGYSFGEYVAAAVAGIFTPRDVMKIILLRESLVRRFDDGGMLSVPMSAQEVASYLSSHLDLAIDNGSSCVISGSHAELDKLEETIKSRRMMSVRLSVPYAGHSKLLRPVAAELVDAVREIPLSQPDIPVVSGLSGDYLTTDQAQQPEYWGEHLTSTSRFFAGATKLLENPGTILVEIGAGWDLCALVGRIAGKEKVNHLVSLIPPMQKKQSPLDFWWKKIGQLWGHGVPIDWGKVHALQFRFRIPLPLYPFQRQDFTIPDSYHKHLLSGGGTIQERPGKLKKKESTEEWLYVASWKQSPALAPVVGVNASENSIYLVFADEQGFGDTIVNQLRQRNTTVISVSKGTAFEVHGAEHFSVDPLNKYSYQELGNELNKRNLLPNRVIHCWSLDSSPSKLGLLSLVYWISVLGTLGDGTPVRSAVISNQMQEVTGEEALDPMQSPVLGAVRVMGQEYLHFECISLDIALPVSSNALLKQWGLQCVAELEVKAQDHYVAYRGRHRWVQSFEPVIPWSPGVCDSKLRSQGIYLITGGLGYVGRRIASYVAQKTKGTLILTGRSSMNNDLKRRLGELNGLGAKTVYYVADVADEKRMKEVVSTVESEYGAINGVVHAAGIPGGQLFRVMKDVSMDDLAIQFPAKVYGPQVLAEVFKERDLDFCLLTTSIASVLGALGNSIYTAANRFGDAFAHSQNQRLAKQIWCSIDWDHWNDIEEIEGVQLLDTMFSKSLPGRLIVSPFDLAARVRQWDKSSVSIDKEESEDSDQAKAIRQARPILTTPFVEAKTDLERKLADIWARFFGLAEVGVDDEFFELGGDSLKAMTVLMKVNRVFDVEVPLSELFRLSTIRGMAGYIESASKKESQIISPAEKKEYYPLSSAQKRMFLLQQLMPDTIGYNELSVARLQGTVSIDKFQDAVRKIIQRHECFRTSFILIDGEPVQRILSRVDFSLEILDAKASTETSIDLFIRPFDLSIPPHLRIAIIPQADNQWLVLLDVHHIVFDGVSKAVFMDELTALLEGKSLPTLALHYKDYAEWQHRSRHQLKTQEAYWLERFSGSIPKIQLPLDHPRPAVQDFAGGAVSFSIDRVLKEKIVSLAQSIGLTLYMMLMGIFSIFLAKLSRQQDVIVGTPTAGRSNLDIAEIIGIFVNTLCVRTNVEPESSVLDYLLQVRETTLQAFENQDFQFEDLVERLSINRDTGRNPLFDVLFVFHNVDGPTHNQPGDRNGNISSSSVNVSPRISKFDLTLNGEERNQEIALKFEYSKALFEETTINRFVDYFKCLVSAVVDHPDSLISHIQLLDEKNREQVLADFNRTSGTWPLDSCLLDIYQCRLDRIPDGNVLTDGSRNLTAIQFDTLMRRIKGELLQKGFGAGKICAVKAERSMRMIAGIFAIIAAGGTYMPVDADIPPDRLMFILNDSECEFLLGDSEKIQDFSSEAQTIELPFEEEPGEFQGQDPVSIDPHTPAYIIYTSGSTGVPKGVLVEHGSVVNILSHLEELYPLEAGDVYLFKTNVTFDVSITELFSWIFGNGVLAVPNSGVERDMDALIDFIKQVGVTHVNFVPSQLSVFVDYLRDSFGLDGLALKYVFAAGEAFSSTLAETFRQLRPSFKVENIYGPTEGTIYASGYSLASFSGNHWVPIGKPLKNIHCYILDSLGQPLPILVPGELHLGGQCVARGYLNRPEMTHERFVRPENGAGISDERLYRTGDVARWLPDGNIQYMGRIDHQVKIRGYRIELGEIETRMTRHPQIREAVVVVRRDQVKDTYLCAFYTAIPDENAGPLGKEELLEFMAGSLPEYMLPAHLIEVEEFKRTSTGKVDRKALEEYQLPSNKSSVDPMDFLEKRLLVLWAEVLGVGEDSIGRCTNFFQTGGHSLKMATLLVKVTKTLGIKLSMLEAFHTPTIAGMARKLREKGYTDCTQIVPREKRDYYPVSPSQRRLYILQQIDPDSAAYHLTDLIDLSPNSDIAKIEAVLGRLIQRHESFRTSFHVIAGQTVQRIHPEVDFHIEKIRLDENNVPEGNDFRAFIRPFDLARPPLMRMAYVKSKEQNYLLVDLHHIISDGLSHMVMLNDFQSFYDGTVPEPLSVQYRDYCQWLQEEVQAGSLEAHREFWLLQFSVDVSPLEMPIDFKRPPVQSFAGATRRFKFSSSLTEELYELARKNNATLFMVLLSIYSVMLSRLSGQDDIVIGTPVAGRGQDELERIIGVFINMLPMRCSIQSHQSFAQYLGQIRERALEAFDHQEYPFDLLVDQLNVQRDTSRNPVFDAVLMVQNFYYRNDDLETGQSIDVQHGTAKFDITLYVEETQDSLRVAFEYCTQLFKAETIERFIGYLQELTTEVCRNPQIPMANISIIPEPERRRVLEEFNRSSGSYPRTTVFDLFSRHVESAPDCTALVFGEQWFTYGGLHKKNLDLAGTLQGQGFKSGDIAAIVLERSAELMISLLAVMAAGGAYLYLDPDYPVQRKRFMLEDSGASVAICTPGSDMELPSPCQRLVVESNMNYSDRDGVELPGLSTDPESLVYVSYTSGSTGKPKGVMIRHKSVANFISAMLAHIPVGPEDRVFSLTTASFDIFVLEAFLPLGSGATMILGSRQEQLDVSLSAQASIRHKTTLLQLTPSRLQFWVSNRESASALSFLKYLVAGGELFPQTLADQVIQLTSARTFNVYGPTETTVWSTICPIKAGHDLTIGNPLLNNRIYILNKEGMPQPIGVSGELYIAGDGLAVGYLNRPELTAGRFVIPEHVQEERLYRTGDLARWLPDGTIEFLGRIDNQVKLRGFRIELGEIQARLLAHPEIREAVVLIKETDSGPSLGAYLVADREFSVTQLRQFLSESLPEYMIPAFFSNIEKIPLTPNGKADLKSLLELDGRIGTGEEFIAPETGIEQEIASIWRKVLEIDKIGSYDNFFELGGNSMGLLQVSEELSRLLGKNVPVVTLYRYMTIHSLAKFFAAEADDVMKKSGILDRKDEIDKGKARLRNRIKRKSK